MCFRTVVLLVLLMLVTLCAGSGSEPESREQRELRMADGSIVAALMISRTPRGHNLCDETRFANLGADKAEVGLALIGARKTKLSIAALAALLRYRFDGVLSEDYTCYVLERGKMAKDALVTLKVDKLEKQCQSEVDHFARGERDNWFEGLKTGSVCSDSAYIEGKKQELVDAIDKGKKCSLQDF